MQIPGAGAELEEVRQKLLGMAEKVGALIDLIQPRVDDNYFFFGISP
jgi:hypothetical protein